MQDPNLPEGWTQDKIDEELDRQYKNKEFCCSQGCGWVVGECKHRTFDGKIKEVINE
jgi:hypothetical protein